MYSEPLTSISFKHLNVINLLPSTPFSLLLNCENNLARVSSTRPSDRKLEAKQLVAHPTISVQTNLRLILEKFSRDRGVEFIDNNIATKTKQAVTKIGTGVEEGKLYFCN